MSNRLYIFYGKWTELLSDIGELEPVINSQDALTLGALRSYLEALYDEVIITDDRNSIDWQYPVISLGGPIPNSLTKEIGEESKLPVWFLDTPYTQNVIRKIGSQREVFLSKFNDDGLLVTDFGFISRVQAPGNPSQYLFIIAGNYGIGGWGVVRHLISQKNLKDLRKYDLENYFQIIIRSDIQRGRVHTTEIARCRNIKQ